MTTTKKSKIRDRMVKDSLWRITKDFEVRGDMDNPAWTRGGTEPVQLKNQIILTGKAGTEIRIDGGFSTYGRVGKSVMSGASLVPVINTKTGNKTFVPYLTLKDIVEEISVPLTKVYVIKDTTTGKLYSDTSNFYDKLDFSRKTEIIYTDKFSQAKKFTDIGKLRVHLLNITGYFDGLDGGMYYVYESSSNLVDIPDTWVAAEYNKVTKEELSTIDIQTQYKRTWSIRELTKQYGSTVRSVYNEIDKKGLLDDYSAVVMFRPNDDNKELWSYNNDTKTKLKEEVDAVIKKAVKKGEYVRKLDGTGIAVGLKKKSLAVMLKLAYKGEMKINVLDIKEMKEIVENTVED